MMGTRLLAISHTLSWLVPASPGVNFGLVTFGLRFAMFFQSQNIQARQSMRVCVCAMRIQERMWTFAIGKTRRTTARLRPAIIVAIIAAIAASAIVSPSNLMGDEVRILHSEVDGLSERIAIIDGARTSVDVAYYEIHDDECTGQFLASLVRAANRGVRVRFLCDGHLATNNMPKALMELLIERGVCIREFPADTRYRVELGRQRLHDKLVIVDGQTLLTGGRNLTSEYYGISSRICIDRDILLVGHAASHAETYFQTRWSDSRSRQPTLTREEKSKVVEKQVHPHWNTMPRCQAKIEASEWLAACELAPLAAKNSCLTQTPSQLHRIPAECATFLHDFSNRDCGANAICIKNTKQAPGTISSQLLVEIRRARCSIEIESPYFAITHQLKELLIDAEARGVRVRVLTNSLESTDQIPAQAGYANQRRSLLRGGIELYELRGRDTLHAKSMVVDGEIAMIGSYNFDVLSETRSSEVALLVRDRGVATELLESMSLHRSHATEVRLGDLLRHEARESNVPMKDLREFQRLRLAAPFIKPYL